MSKFVFNHPTGIALVATAIVLTVLGYYVPSIGEVLTEPLIGGVPFIEGLNVGMGVIALAGSVTSLLSPRKIEVADDEFTGPDH